MESRNNHKGRGPALAATLDLAVESNADAGPDALAPTVFFVSQDNLVAGEYILGGSGTARDMPAWQQDAGFVSAQSENALQERNNIIQSLNYVGRHGVILGRNGKVVVATDGWVDHIRVLPTLSLKKRQLGCITKLSQCELNQAIETTLSNATREETRVALRDLDGWVRHYLQLRRVGFHNPELVLVLLPDSPQALSRRLADLALQLSLSEIEVTLLRCLLDGQNGQEIARNLKISGVALKKITGEMVGKFGVRQKSDVIRLLAATH